MQALMLCFTLLSLVSRQAVISLSIGMTSMSMKTLTNDSIPFTHVHFDEILDGVTGQHKQYHEIIPSDITPLQFFKEVTTNMSVQGNINQLNMPISTGISEILFTGNDCTGPSAIVTNMVQGVCYILELDGQYQIANSILMTTQDTDSVWFASHAENGNVCATQVSGLQHSSTCVQITASGTSAFLCQNGMANNWQCVNTL